MPSISLNDEPYRSWLGPLWPYLGAPEVTCLIAAGPARLSVERRWQIEPVSGQLAEGALEAMAASVATTAGEATGAPIVVLQLLEGGSVVVLRAPLVEGGPHLAIHRPATAPASLDALIDRDVVPHVAAPLLDAAVVGRRGILVVSAAGLHAGPLLEGLATRIDPGQRVIAVEGRVPLRLEHPGCVTLRPEALPREQRAEALAAASLLRPDRVVLSDMDRGTTRWFLETSLQAPGSLALTQGADACTALLAVESYAAAAGVPLDAARAQIAAAFSLVAVVGRLTDGRLSLFQLAEVISGAAGYALRDLFVIAQAADDEAAVPVLVPTGRVPRFLPSLVPFGASLDPGTFSGAHHGLPPPPSHREVGVEDTRESAVHSAPRLPVSMTAAGVDFAPRFVPPSLDVPAPPAVGLPTSDDPGWEVDALNGVEQLEPPSLRAGVPPTQEDSRFAEVLRARREEEARARAAVPLHVPSAPAVHPQFLGHLLEPPPPPAAAPAPEGFEHRELPDPDEEGGP